MSRSKANPFPGAPPLIAAPHEPTGCRFIFGDPGPFSTWRYCQAEQDAGSAYCPVHRALCTRAPSTEADDLSDTMEAA